MQDWIKAVLCPMSTSVVGQSQHVQHVVLTRSLVLPPKRCLESATGKQRAITGDMAQQDAFAFGYKQNVVFSHDIAATNGTEADIAALCGCT